MRSDVLVLLMVVVCGCAGSYVQPQMQTTATRLPRPPRVLVYDFAVSPDEIVEDQNVLRQFADAETDTTDSRRARTIAHDIADSMADALVARIRAMGLRAERAGRDTRVYYDDLKIEGAFLDVNQGNQLKRLVIGFGVGASRVDTEVEVFQAQPRGPIKVAQFSTHANSGMMPGAAVTMGAGAAAGGLGAAGTALSVGAGGLKAYRSEVDNLAAMSADQAAAYLSQLFAREGWIAQ